MRTLIIFASPNPKGHCAAILRKVLDVLRTERRQYDLLDLYRMRYNPVLPFAELYTAGNRNVSPQNAKIQEFIKSAERLIFIYPVWWQTMPAVLKGFFDRVLTPGFAYRFHPFGFPIKFLKGKRAAVFMTGGASNLVHLFYLQNRVKILITRDILGFCGIKSRAFLLGNARRLDERQEERIQKMVKKGMRWLYS